MADPEITSSMTNATVLQELVGWSRCLPLWQQDALRRLCQHGELTEDDIAELVQICRSQHILPEEGETSPVAEQISLEHVQANETSAGSVTLKAIKEVGNVNILAEGQTLRFSHEGLSIIYGRNGSGKSGYARVLRRVCRARHPGGRILGNAYSDETQPPASATIEYRIGNEDHSTSWIDGEAAPVALSAISVFDSDCAMIHVDGTNEVAYMPHFHAQKAIIALF